MVLQGSEALVAVWKVALAACSYAKCFSATTRNMRQRRSNQQRHGPEIEGCTTLSDRRNRYVLVVPLLALLALSTPDGAQNSDQYWRGCPMHL
jgi:hypothetical protein